jgi:hemerythrin superfamily protein
MAERNDSLRGAGVFALGALAGIVLSRVGAPLAAKTVGLARSAAGGRDAFEELAADHARVLALLAKAEVEQTGPKKMALFLAIKRDLSKHAVAEEDVIYPLIADKLLADDAAHHLYKEHGIVKVLLSEIEEALENGDDMRYRARVRLLRESVQKHAGEEETQWFPRLKELLDEKKRALVTGKLDREKAMMA